MKILAPVNNPKEVDRIIGAGADEIYCGVIPSDWMSKYTNVASVNRREWVTANLNSFFQLKEVINIAHSSNIPVYVTLNALYTKSQYPLLLNQVKKFEEMKVDALIVADLGLLLTLRKEKIDLDVHISTGGTTFNSQTAKFYEQFGISRIVLPRHLKVEEAEEIVKKCPAIGFEVFILNSGCKNIDGFCTFQHGINEILHKQMWNLPKKLNFDRHFLNILRRLPKNLVKNIKTDIFGVDSACLLNYKVFFSQLFVNLTKKEKQLIKKNISDNFSLFSGIDTCGACRLSEFQDIGICSVKIVGRNYSTEKKVKDVKFLKTILSCLENRSLDKQKFKEHVRSTFRRIYKLDCGKLCYYPDGV